MISVFPITYGATLKAPSKLDDFELNHIHPPVTFPLLKRIKINLYREKRKHIDAGNIAFSHFGIKTGYKANSFRIYPTTANV